MSAYMHTWTNTDVVNTNGIVFLQQYPSEWSAALNHLSRAVTMLRDALALPPRDRDALALARVRTRRQTPVRARAPLGVSVACVAYRRVTVPRGIVSWIRAGTRRPL